MIQLKRDCSFGRKINYMDWTEIFKDHREFRKKKVQFFFVYHMYNVT